MKLEGRVACVTGGGSGLGRAIARAMAAEGASVVVTDLRGETAEETVKGLDGSGHLALAGDVSDPETAAATFRAIRDAHGRVDVLVNNAGVDRLPDDGWDELLSGEVQLLHMSNEAFTRMQAIHVHGAFFHAKEAARLMIPKGSGTILNMSSIAGLAGVGPAHYSTAKAGLLGLTKSLARELGRHGIRVNAICPGAIDTPMTEGLDERMMKGLVAATPLQRMGTAEEIAALAVFLCSEEGSFITGQAISPNGGVHI